MQVVGVVDLRRIVAVRQLDDTLGERGRPLGTVGEMSAGLELKPLGLAQTLDGLDLGVGVSAETIEGDDGRQPEILHVGTVAREVGEALLDRRDVLLLDIVDLGPRVRLERPDCGDQHRRRRAKPRDPALDVEELLGPQIGAEARLGDHVVGELEHRLGGDDRVAAVGDVGERLGRHSFLC